MRVMRVNTGYKQKKTLSNMGIIDERVGDISGDGDSDGDCDCDDTIAKVSGFYMIALTGNHELTREVRVNQMVLCAKMIKLLPLVNS